LSDHHKGGSAVPRSVQRTITLQIVGCSATIAAQHPVTI